MSGHTPGPWVLRPLSYGYDLTVQGVGGPGSYGGWFVELHSGAGGHADDEFEANARLISAAPDLLAACKDALGAFENNDAIDWSDLERAIAKAEGR